MIKNCGILGLPSIQDGQTLHRGLYLIAAALIVCFAIPPARGAAQENMTLAPAKIAPVAAPKIPAKDDKPISAASFEKRYGIRVTLVAVTGGGGLVDFRFKVLDSEKAKQLIPDAHHLPALIAADSGQKLVATHRMMNNIRLQNGIVCFLLYPNVNNSIKTGTSVLPEFGGVRLAPIKVQ
jgi:hypothetical protein